MDALNNENPEMESFESLPLPLLARSADLAVPGVGAFRQHTSA